METRLLNQRYRQLNEIGTGELGTVYRAQDTTLRRTVAIKVLHDFLAGDAEFMERVQIQAQAIGALDPHPNVVSVFDFGTDDGQVYLVTEYVDGRDLKSMILDSSPMSLDQAIEIAIGICQGVGYVHHARLLHGGIKPQNVLVTADRQVKVTDFGLALALPDSIRMQLETIEGSPAYHAPELTLGQISGYAADVYAIGVIVFEMLAGRLPFESTSITGMLRKHIEDPPPLITRYNPQVPLAVEQVLLQALHKKPAYRYHSAEQFGLELQRIRVQAQQLTAAVSMPLAQQAIAAIAQAEAVPMSAPPVIQLERIEGSSNFSAAPAMETEPGKAEPDRLLWILTVIAIIAVLGLFPLWALVYQAYRTRSLPPSPSPALAFPRPDWKTNLVKIDFSPGKSSSFIVYLE